MPKNETAQTETPVVAQTETVETAAKRTRKAPPNANIPQFDPSNPDSLADSVRTWAQIANDDSVNGSTFNANGFMGPGALRGRNEEVTMGRSLNCSAQSAYVLAQQATQHRESLAGIMALAAFVNGLAERAEKAYAAHASIQNRIL